MMPAEGDGGAVGRSGRKSRANAGARLKDILQQEAKDLRTLEAEADQETEETAHAVSTKKARQRHQQAHPDEGTGLVAAANGTPQANSDEPQLPAPGTTDNEPAATVKSEPELAAAANGAKARKKPAPVEDAAAVAATPAAAPAPRAIRAPLQRLPRPTRGPDEGPGAALGQALGAADACWSASKEAGAATKQQLQQQRGTKRKRAGKAGTPPPEGADVGTEDGEEATVAASNNGSGVVAQQPVGKVLPVGSRPSWLVQAVEGGSTALNKRQAKALVDDLSQPQQVEFMMGCASCDYQQHGCAECRVRPEVSRPMARWQPDSGHPQVDLGDAATFTPSKEDFADPFAYIASIAEQFVKQGIAKIVPPPGCWASPAYVQQLKAACSSGGSDCSVAEGLVFNAQRQFLSHLCMRAAPAVGNGTVATAAAAAGPSSSQCQAPSVEQLLGPDVELLRKLEQQADAGPAHPLAAAEGHPAGQQGSRASAGPAGDDDAGQGATPAAAAAASPGQPDHTVAVKQEAGIEQQQLEGLEHPQQQPSSVCTHTLRSFAAYADWAKRMHFSCQPCNAELHAVLQPTAAAQGRQRQSSMTGLPPAKRPKPDADHLPQPSRDTGTEAEGTEDTDMDGAAESNRDVAQQHPPERHSSRLQAKGRAPLHPLKATAGSGRGASPEPAAAKAKASKAATSTTSATPPTTPRTKAVKSGSGTRLVGAAAGMLGLAAVFPESAISMDQFEAEFWRVVEQQQPGRLVEAVHAPELRSNSSSSTAGGSSLVQELQEQLDWTYDQLQQEAGAPEAGAWDLSSLPCRRENLLRYLPLQQGISGLTEPVLGLSSCLSSCCWQLTPQGMYGISCLHSGAPRVWYAVPESACDAFQVALQDCLPHLFAANPALLQQAVTAVSPNELRARGVPVCRLIQEPGTFVVLLPNAFHSWVSTGFSIHESVALAPWDCLGAGGDAERSSRQQRHPTPVSQTELLVTLVSSCRCVADAHGPGGGDIEAEADEQATAVATAALAAVSKARTQRPTKAGKQQPHQQRQQQQEQPAGAQQGEAASEQAGQQGAAGGVKQQQRGKQQQSNRQQPRQRQKSPSQRKPRATAADSDSSNSHGDGGSGSDADAVSAESLALSSDSSSSSGSSSSSEGSDSEAEASQPCWGAAAGAQQLLEPGLAWASGACASAALELVPKPAILAAVGELVLRVEEEQCRQAVARQHGIKQEQRMHGAVLPVSHCGVCCTDLWLSAVVSSEAPGQAVCPEHAAALSAAPDSCTLLFRHSVEELQRLLFEAAALFPGCADDIRAAQQRVRTRPVIRGLKSLGPVLPLSQELPAPRAPELKPGGREPATPTADWVKQLMALATARLPLVGHGAAARLPHRQRRGAVEEALQVAAAAFEAVKAGGSIDAISFGQKLPVRHVRRKDDAVQMVVQQLLRQGVSSKASKGKGGQQQQPQQQQHQSEASGSDDEAEGGDQRKERAPLQPRQRKLPGWLQSECVVDKAVAKRAKGGPAGSKGSKATANATGGAADRSGGEGKAAVTVAFSLAEVVPLAEQALEVVAAQRALIQQAKQQRRQQQEQRKQQRLQEQQYEQQQEQRRQRQQQEHRMGNGVTHSVAQQQLHQLQQQQLLALQQQSQQLLLAAAPASQHRPPQARASRESLREGGSSGGRPKGRGGGRGAGSRGECRSSTTSGGRRGMAGAVAGVGTEQQQQLAAQLTLQQLQLQAQFRAAALAAAAAAAGQGAPAAATVPAVSSAAAAAAAAAGGQLGQAAGAGVPGFVGFPGPLITMHNGVPVLIFAAPLPQQQSGSTAAAASADPAAQSAAAAAAAPVEAGDEVQQMGQQQQLGQGQQAGQQQQQDQQPNHVGAALTSSAVPAAAADAAAGSLASPNAAQASAGATAATPGASDAAASAAAAAAGPSPGAGDAPAHCCGLLPASSMQHSSGQLTDAEAAAAAAHAEAEAVASRAAAEAVAAAAAEARLVAGIVGNGHHHPQGPAVSAAAAPALAAGNTAGSQPVLQHQQPSLMSPGPAASAAPVGAPSAAMGSAEAAATAPVTMALQPAAYQAWQLPPLAPAAAAATSVPAAGAAVGYGVTSSAQLLASVSAPGQAVHVEHGPSVSTEPPVECMLQVEEFFHSQEPGHADIEAATPPAPEQPATAAVQAPAAAGGGGPDAVPAAGPEATTAAATTAAPDAWLLPVAASGLPCSSAGAMAPPAQAVAAASTAAIGWQAAQGEAGCLQVLEQQHKANAVPAAAQTATGGAAADIAGSVGRPAAQGGTSSAALAPAAAAAGAGSAPVAAPARAPAPQAAAGQRTAGAGGPSGDDEMDELELEPLVDGMDDFDW